MFINPRMIAIDLSKGLCQSHFTPSASSERHELGAESSGRSARKIPGIRATRAAAMKKDAASTKKGRENMAISSSEPMGGPMKVLATASALHMRPLARSRCSGATSAGMIVCPQLSRNTSAQPRSKVATSRTTYSPTRVPTTSRTSSGVGREPCLDSTAMATTTVSSPRRKSIATIARRRSTRSVITPAGKVNKSHGRRCTAATRAIRRGLRVIAVASHG